MQKLSKRQKLTKIWLSCWLYVITAIAGIIIGILAANWSEWTLQTKLVAMGTSLLAFHVLEEWHFPGGFHYMYNIMADSDIPDRYPMNQLSDMWTNWIGIVFGCFCLIAGVTPLFAVMQFLLCLGEIFAHTKSGFYVKKIYNNKGKRTIYNPGLFTALFGYLPLAIALFVSFFAEKTPTLAEVILAIVFGIILMAISLPGAEKICKDKKTPYGYTWGDGYFEKYKNN